MHTRALLLVLLCFTLPFAAHAQKPGPTSVVFLSPDDSRFWQMVGGFMQAMANDLEVDLMIRTDLKKHRYSYRDLLAKVLSQPEKPDYILLMCKENVTHEMLTMIGEAGIKVFTFNTEVPESEVGLTGRPREKMEHWIGHVSPDNRSAGSRLAVELYQRYQHRNGREPVALIGLSGTRDSSAAIHRNRGLEDMLAAHPSMTTQVLFANWSAQDAENRVDRLIDRYPSLGLIWSASDGMALGAINAAETRGLVPGQDILLGGVDWEESALEEIDRGRLELSLGRHFMGGGLALLLIHDYQEGYDFADQGSATMSYDFSVVDKNNLDAVRQIMNQDNWEDTDFTRFSRHHNERLRQTPVSASGILDEFMGALSPGFR